MTKADLSDMYRDYIACLNKQDWPNLGQFVHEEVHYNGERIGLSGYREMLEGDFRAIPDLYFDIHLLISEPPRVASRLSFDCTPKGILFGLHVNGRRVSFTENVFYEFRDERIEKVWSVIDKAAIESQLQCENYSSFRPIGEVSRARDRKQCLAKMARPRRDRDHIQ